MRAGQRLAEGGRNRQRALTEKSWRGVAATLTPFLHSLPTHASLDPQAPAARMVAGRRIVCRAAVVSIEAQAGGNGPGVIIARSPQQHSSP